MVGWGGGDGGIGLWCFAFLLEEFGKGKSITGVSGCDVNGSALILQVHPKTTV